MSAFAELEIGLYPYKEGEYTFEHRFFLPESDADVRLGRDGPARVKLDLIELRTNTFTPKVYAGALTGCFFRDTQISEVFEQARKLAGSKSVPLRVRLFISPGAADLHSIFWEQLLDPGNGSPLFAGEKIYFSRYLSSPDPRPVKLEPKDKFKTLVFIANPSDLASRFRDMAPIDVQGEVQRAEKALDENPTMLFSDGPATLENLTQALREQKPDILYLVCHGAMQREEPYLWLENENGQTIVTAGRDLVARIKNLSEQPLLVVLASCDSAGKDTAGDARAALGPRLAEAGVPAVVAMQGKISMPTVEKFMPVFFTELRQDGQIDRAMAVARAQVLANSDYWMPVLFTRLRNGCLFAEERVTIAKPNWRLRGAIAALVVALLALLGFGAWNFNRPGQMGKGFNIAVAEFGEVDSRGRVYSSERGKAVSQGLYGTILNSLKQLPTSYQFESRGPGEVGIVTGKDAQARDEKARIIAARWNARVLVYGVLQKTPNGYVIEPSFYVTDKDFRYGSEITGPNRLGLPVTIDFEPGTDPQKIVEINKELHNRTSVLTHLVKGLASFFVGDYDESALEFQRAIDLPFWEDEPEKKAEAVVYVLWGSAQLRAYNAFNRDQSQVKQARAAFEQATLLDDRYARAYLGLGSATLEEANRLDGNQEARLYEARDWINTALKQPDQPPTAYVPLKAAYELGQVYLLGFEQKFAGFDKEQARQYFQQVLDGYEKAGRPGELLWYAAGAHYYLGRLKGWDEDWTGMAGECTLGNQEVEQLSSTSRYIVLLSARADFCVGWARMKQNRLAEASTLIQRAIDRAGKYATPAERDEWIKTLEILVKGTSTP